MNVDDGNKEEVDKQRVNTGRGADSMAAVSCVRTRLNRTKPSLLSTVAALRQITEECTAFLIEKSAWKFYGKRLNERRIFSLPLYAVLFCGIKHVLLRCRNGGPSLEYA